MLLTSENISFPDSDEIDEEYRGRKLHVLMSVDRFGTIYSVGGKDITDPGALAHLATTGLVPAAYAEYM